MIAERLKELNITIPEAAKPLSAYIPACRNGNLVITSGQLPVINGAIQFVGKVGAELSTEQAKEAARLCAINCLSAVVSVAGDVEMIEQIVKLTVFVNSAAGFTAQPEVANGASELMIAIFGENGKHVRCAVGVAELPRNAAVEIEMIARVRD
jgi:enamine deaminase RidA (YjgF/YER057c/UK114 family)